MNTWSAEKPPELSPPSFGGKVVGGVRVGLLLLVTLISVALFLAGRGLRALLGRWVTFHFGVAWLWARACLRLAGVRLTIHGTPIHSGALVANHSSWLDILALRSVCLMYFVSKAEVANWPGVGFITRITGTVFIERRRTEAKRQEAILRERIAAEQLLCFFPEGTSTDGLRVLPFKSSLFSAFFQDGQGTDIQIQPVSIRYRPAPSSDLPASFYGWWADMGFESHIWDVVTRSHAGEVDVIFHPPVLASQFDDRKQLADHTMRKVEIGHETGHPAHSSPGPHLATEGPST
jgi:1-acyl-sn-glycerol-3-phosphate acyltransferase